MPISPRDFVHPEDQAALENLKAIPLFASSVKAVMKVASEQFLHGLNMAQKIRLGSDQLPEIYRYLPPICQVLGIAEPELYLEMDHNPNAYTYGNTRTFITLTSGLVESLEEDELQAVIAHECGHVACQHVLYHSIADMLIQYGSSAIAPLAMISGPAKLALLYWYRRSELSADRAAALVLKDPKPVVDTMVRLAGGPKSITGNVNIDAYIQQAEAYDKLQESTWDKVLQGVAIMHQNHPFLAVRAREITEWCAGEHFRRLVACLGEAERAPKCPACGALVGEGWSFCKGCGRDLPASAG